MLMKAAILAGELSVLLTTSAALAAGGTDIVAREGQPAHVRQSWPEGAGEIVNDPARTKGWNSWFSEWPSDVNQYGFRVKSIDDVNRLIAKLAEVDAPLKRIHLSPLPEPSALGFVTVLPQRNRIPVIFSIGDQSAIDRWYERVEKPFGKMEFVDTPVAVPPTLTIFVGHQQIELDQLEIPPDMTVLPGSVPTVFLRSNTTIEKEREKAARQIPEDERVQKSLQGLDEEARVVAEEILDYLDARKQRDAESTADE